MTATANEVKYTFFFEDKWHETTGNQSQLLMEISEASEIRTPHACQEGGCGSCKCKLLDGKVDMRNSEILSADEIEAGYILACQSKPITSQIKVNFDID